MGDDEFGVVFPAAGMPGAGPSCSIAEADGPTAWGREFQSTSSPTGRALPGPDHRQIGEHPVLKVKRSHYGPTVRCLFTIAAVARASDCE